MRVADARCQRIDSSSYIKALEQCRSGFLDGNFPSTFLVIILWTIDPRTWNCWDC